MAHKLTMLRRTNTDSATFRRLTEQLVTLLGYEATRDVRVHGGVEVQTPGGAGVRGVHLDDPPPLVVPILRAGLGGMLEGMLRLMPTAEVGFVGMIRNEATLEPYTYAERLPKDLSGRSATCWIRCWPPAAHWAAPSTSW